MQGRKDIEPKILYNVNLDDLVSKDNFYRKLNAALNLQANKHIMMAALTYNLKKYLRFISYKAVSKVCALREEIPVFAKTLLSCFNSFVFPHQNFSTIFQNWKFCDAISDLMKPFFLNSGNYPGDRSGCATVIYVMGRQNLSFHVYRNKVFYCSPCHYTRKIIN